MLGIDNNKFVVLKMSSHSVKRAMEFTGTKDTDGIYEKWISKPKEGVVLCIDGIVMMVPWGTAIIKRNDSFLLATEFDQAATTGEVSCIA